MKLGSCIILKSKGQPYVQSLVLKGKRVAPDLYVLGGCLFIYTLSLIFHQIHIHASRVYSSDTVSSVTALVILLFAIKSRYFSHSERVLSFRFSYLQNLRANLVNFHRTMPLSKLSFLATKLNDL